jgi:hypothetical protein
MRRRLPCADADPIRWLAAGIDLAHSMLSRRRRQPPKAASPNRLGPPSDSVSVRPTSLPSVLRAIVGIREKPKSP